MKGKIFLGVALLVGGFNARAQHSTGGNYLVPDVLTTLNGEKADTQYKWETVRRPEILRLFEDNVYGQMPKDFDRIASTVTHEVSDAMDGKAHFKEVTITVWRAGQSVDIHLTLFTPVAAKRYSVFLLINNRDKSNTDPTRKVKSDFWPAEMIIENGYAVAAFQVDDAAPDDSVTYKNGVLRLYPEQLKTPNGMKAIGAWAWAASRVLDYFETDKDIDAKKVNLVGHSRGGKTALWAGAQDPRFAMIFANCSGNTGAALARRDVGESVKAINTVFPHWFCDNYKKYNDHVDDLPLDQHMLIALIAPRPLYTTSATEDLWADPVGSYMAIHEAQRIYSLYRMPSALSPSPPFPDSPIIESILGYHIRTGPHDLTAYDWKNFIRFAEYWKGLGVRD